MACAFHTGKHHRVQVTAQTFSSGDSWGGAALGTECFRVTPDGFSWEKQPQQEPIPELNPHVNEIISGGAHYSFSLSCVMDYEDRNNLLVAALHDTPATTGASAPFSHVLQNGIERYFTTITGWYTSADGETIVSEALSDCWITGVTFSIEPPNGVLMMEVSGIAREVTRDAEEASLPTITETGAPVRATHITALSIDGETDWRLGSLSIAINKPSTENDGYGLASADNEILDFIDVNETDEVTAQLSIRSKEAVVTGCDPGTELSSPFSITFNNGGAAAEERELTFTFGATQVMSKPQNIATIGRISQEVAIQAKAKDGYDLQVTLKNDTDVIPLAS